MPRTPPGLDNFEVIFVKGNNNTNLGIAAVSARVCSGHLMVHFPNCLNLLEEAKAYRYPRQDERARVGENPIDESNYALSALRCLVSRLDVKFIARLRKSLPQDGSEEVAQTQEDLRDTIHSTFGVKPWLRIDNDGLFERLG